MISKLVSRFYKTRTLGSDLSKRIYFEDDSGKPISPWHDIPFRPSKFSPLNTAVIEISRHNITKYEMCLEEELNPIKPDSRKNKITGKDEVRFYGRFPLFNYGFIPQTWESSHEGDSKYNKYHGDGDPIDIVEIGSLPISTGTVIDIKIVGAMCLIDEGEADWKILCMNASDAAC